MLRGYLHEKLDGKKNGGRDKIRRDDSQFENQNKEISPLTKFVRLFYKLF